MKSRLFAGVVILCGACAGWAVTLLASDPVGTYALVEKTVLEPSDGAPQRIQIWGAFEMANRDNPDNYGAPQRGYLYYSCPQGQESVCRNEWADLKSVAGTGTVIGFGGRYKDAGRVRKADEKVASPDPYPIQMGVVRMTGFRSSLPVIDQLKAAVKEK
jgi:hypothetical protein